MIDPIIIPSAIKFLVDLYLKSRNRVHKTSPALGEFCTRNKAFRVELGIVKSVIEDYVGRKTHKRPLNILLSASPGGGKSFLAKQIQETCGGKNTSFQEVYIPALSVANDLNNKFIEIANTGKTKKGAKTRKRIIPFVLFDEMDVDINGQHLYGNFLGPIWDGKICSGSIDYDFKHSVFLFAGSASFPALSKQGIQNLARFEPQPITYEAYRNNWIRELEQRIDGDNTPKKLKDFVDRMDIFVCIPPTDPVLMTDENVGEELMDIVCILVKQYFSNIDTIELSAALCLMQELKYHPSRRVVESILQCSSCKGVYNEFLFDHLSEAVRERYKKDKDISKAKNIKITIS